MGCFCLRAAQLAFINVPVKTVFKTSPKTSENQDYRFWLKDAFSRRCAANPRYSLRAFARDLGMTAAQLSFVLNYKRNLSVEKAKDVARVIGLSAEQTNLFCAQVGVETARSKVSKEVASIKLQVASDMNVQEHSINLDAFRVISDWHHFAILQLMKLEFYREDSKWIADSLGINTNEVSLAVERLVRLDLCEWNSKKKRHEATEDFVFAPNGVPSDAIRKFHRQCIEKALNAIETQSIEDRFLSTSILAVNKRDLPQARKSIQAFQKKFMKKFETNRNLDQVVCLSVQMFKMNEIEKEKEV